MKQAQKFLPGVSAVLVEVAFRKPNEADLAATIPNAKKTSSRVIAYKSQNI